MLKEFKQHIKRERLFEEADRVLLAVSGGRDSVLMAHLFREAGCLFGIAHCNFQLRGEAADGDESFVETLAEALEVPFYAVRFDTKEVAMERGISIQMAARDLRYEWLEKIRVEDNYQYLATAHHLNDAIETLIYNLSKGCGIRGLQGIPVRNRAIIRPLLFASGKEIQEEVQRREMPYRKDASNEETKYARNKIRHLVIPPLTEINPALEQTFRENIKRFEDTLLLFERAVSQFRQQYVTEKEGLVFIDKNALQSEPAAATLLHELLRDKGFTPSQLSDALHSDTKTGGLFYSDKWRLLVDRVHYIVAPMNSPFEEVFIQKEGLPAIIPLPDYQLEAVLKSGILPSFSKEKNRAFIDASKLIFPLQIRTWKAGDTFCPLGMKGQHQKIQDFFSNRKLSVFEKEKTLLLVNGNGTIIWVIGERLDERYKIKDSTSEWMEVVIR